jgi:hypothetical protein
MVDNSGIEDKLVRQELIDFLIGSKDSSEPTVIKQARQDTAMDDPSYHLQVISRAALLLRVATGGCAKLLGEADLGKEELRFWWSAFGRDRGLWDSPQPPPDLLDMWADVNNALQGIGKWEIQNKGKATTIAGWRRDHPSDIAVLGGCERIALWGLGM